MSEIFSQFLWNFPFTIKHENHGDIERTKRYNIGLQRLRLLHRFAEPFAYSKKDFIKESREIVYAFLIPVTEKTSSPLIPKDINYEYLAGSVRERKTFTLFSYIWFSSLNEAKSYVTQKRMNIVGGWNEHNELSL